MYNSQDHTGRCITPGSGRRRGEGKRRDTGRESEEVRGRESEEIERKLFNGWMDGQEKKQK